MKSREDQNLSVIAILVTFGVLSSVAVIFAIYLFSQRGQNDPFSASSEFRVFQERQAVTNIRRGIAEDFVVAVVNCTSPPISPGQRLTEQQVTERVTGAIERISSSNWNTENPKCQNSRSSSWTFELPCKLKISESFSKVSGGLNLGEIGVCKTAIIKGILAATRSCPDSADFPACLARAILANEDINNEIEKPIEIQHIYNK
jgi:hypothetical protein